MCVCVCVYVRPTQHAKLFLQVALQPGPADLVAVHGNDSEFALGMAAIPCKSIGKQWIEWDLINVSWLRPLGPYYVNHGWQRCGLNWCITVAVPRRCACIFALADWKIQGLLGHRF